MPVPSSRSVASSTSMSARRKSSGKSPSVKAPSMKDLSLSDEEVTFAKDDDSETEFFDTVVGEMEDILMDDDFQKLQKKFMNKYCKHFDDDEENKLIYTEIFNKYTDLIENYVEEELIERIPRFKMSKFLRSLEQMEGELEGDVFDILSSFNDFLVFKELILSYKAEKEGTAPDLGCLVVTTHTEKKRR